MERTYNKTGFYLMNKTIVEQCSDYNDYKQRLKQLIEVELRNNTIISTNIYEEV